MSDFHVPGLIKVVRVGRDAFVEIDGKAFPFAIAANGITSAVTVDDMPAVTLTLVAHSVEIHDTLDYRETDR